MPGSFWNQARTAGKIEQIAIGPYNHNLKQHYYDQVSRLPCGLTYMEHVVATIGRLLRAAGLEHSAPPAPNHDEPPGCIG